jgi:hypothetical protein
MAVKLGMIGTDSITGFSGTVVSRTEYIHGCTRVCIQPKGLQADGKPIESQYFDELSLVENVTAETDKDKGGPGDCARFPSAPQRGVR